MKSILPYDGGPIAVISGTFHDGKGELPSKLVMIEITGGPILTVEPYVWNDLVRRIRAARSASDIGA